MAGHYVKASITDTDHDSFADLEWQLTDSESMALLIAEDFAACSTVGAVCFTWPQETARFLWANKRPISGTV